MIFNNQPSHGLNPNAVKAMQEVGIDISKQTSDLIHPDILNNADFVVTLCGDANDPPACQT